MPGRIRPGRISSRSLNQQPKWMSVQPPKLRYATDTTSSNNPFKELAETDVYNLRYIKLNEFNTVLTASKNVIEFNSSTTHAKSNDTRTPSYSTEILPILDPPIANNTKLSEDRTTNTNSNGARTSNHSRKKFTLAPPIFTNSKLTPHTTKLITLCNKFHRKYSPMISQPHGDGCKSENNLKKISAKISSVLPSKESQRTYESNSIFKRANKNKQLSPQNSQSSIQTYTKNVSLLREAKNYHDKENMVRSPTSTSATRTSRTSKSQLITLKPETAPVVVRSYSREKLIATILDWYKIHPNPSNPKPTFIRKQLKKNLITEVFHIQDVMRAADLHENTNDMEVSEDEEAAQVITQSQSTSNLEIEDIQRLISEKYYELNGKRTLLTHLHGKQKQELLLILNTMEPELSDEDNDDDDDEEDDDDDYEEAESADDMSFEAKNDNGDDDDGLSLADISLSDSIRECLDNVPSEDENKEIDEEDVSKTESDGNESNEDEEEKSENDAVTNRSIISMDCDTEEDANGDSTVNGDEKNNENEMTNNEDEFEFDDDALAELDIDTGINNKSSTSLTTTSNRSKTERGGRGGRGRGRGGGRGGQITSTSSSRSEKTPTSKPNTIDKNKINKSTKKKSTCLGYGAERLNGCDISAMVPSQVSESLSNNNGNNKVVIRAVDRLTFYIRPRLHVHDNRHAPTLIKAFVRVLRQIDPTLLVLPIDDNDNSLNHVLNSEEAIPNEESEMAKWMAKVHHNIHQKLCFSARISITLPLQEFKRHVFPWCKKNQHWITFDEIQAEETFTPGWLCGLHHKNVDVDNLKGWICKQEGGNNFLNKIKIYPRKIWQTVPNTTEKRMTDVLAIDGSAEKSDEIIKFLYSIQWTGIYDTVTFIPLKINEMFTVSDMIRAIDSQNIHRNTEFCKSIVIAGHDEIHEMHDGINTTFVEWALQCEVRGERVFRNVYAGDENYVKFVYAKENHKEVRAIIGNLYDTVEKFFSVDVAKILFNSKSDFRLSLNIKEAESEYLQATAASLRSNPQGTENDASYKPRGTRTTPSYGPPKVLSPISYSQATVSTTTLSSSENDKIRMLEEKIDKMNAPKDNYNDSVKEQASELMEDKLKKVYDMINTNKKAANEKIKAVAQQVKTSDERNKARIKKSHSSLTLLMLALHRKTIKELKPPSSTKKRRPGGSQ